MLDPILVTKLNAASDPTATIGGTLSAKIKSGSKSTPPPSPVIPIRVPTTKPITILATMLFPNQSRSWQPCSLLNRSLRDLRFRLSGGGAGTDSDEAFSLKMQNDLLCGFFGCHFRGVNHHLGIPGFLVGIRDASELLQDSGARLGVQSLAIPLFANFERRRNMHQDESAQGLDHGAYVFTDGVVRRNRGTDRDPAVLGDLRTN